MRVWISLSPSRKRPFNAGLPRRVQALLETFVERVDADRAPVHRRQHLDVADRVHAEALGHPLGDHLDDGRQRPFGAGAVYEEEVVILALLGLEVRRPAAVDLVGGGRDHRARRLAEDLVEPHDGRDAGGDQVFEGLTGPDRGQLVRVADEDHVGRLGEALEEHLGEAQVEHRGLVDDHQVGGQGCPDRKAGSRPGIHSSMRWIVWASCPVASSSRRAARPVGAQSAIFASAARASATIARVQTVLPTPGPPVRTEIRAAKAPRTAAHCSSVSSSSGASPRPVLQLRRLRGPGPKRLGDGDLRGVGRLPVDAALLEQQPARLDERRRGPASSPVSFAGAPGQLVQRQVGVALLLRLGQRVDGRRLGPAGGFGRHVGGQGDLVGTQRSRRRRPRSAGRGPRAGSPSSGRRNDGGRGGQVGEAVRGELHVQVAHRP